IVALAEGDAFSQAISTMNGLASGIGAGLSLVPANIDGGFHVTSNINADPLTIGVFSIGYAYTSQVGVAVGGSGRVLVRTAGSIPFIGADNLGRGTFILAGDSNWASDNSGGNYVTQDNGKFVRNLCGNALRTVALSGSTAYVEAPDAPKLNLLGDYSVEFWFKDESLDGFDHAFVTLLEKGDRAAGPESPFFVSIGFKHLHAGLRHKWTDVNLDFDLRAAGVDPNRWHHVALTVKSS